MNRREFTKQTQVEIIKRASQHDVPYCEECHQPATRFQIDHTRPDGLEIDKSRKLTAADGRLLCIPCHAFKTRGDVANIARAKRREEKHLGARKAPSVTIQSAGFSPVDRSTKASRLRPASKHEGMGLSNLARRFGL